jgi:RNA polymerase-binding transcription factor DksA
MTNDNNTLEHRKDALMRRRGELTARLHNIENELDAEHSKDFEELATEVEDAEMLEGLGQAGNVEIIKIDAALKRIASGDYGLCISCGTAIDAKRLDVLPYAALCSSCAADLEAR